MPTNNSINAPFPFAASKGGTGVNNTGLLTYGSNNLTFTTTASTTLALPVSGTLIATPGSTSLTTVGTITTGTWHGAVIAPAFGGTGVSNSNTNTLTLGGVINFGNNFTTTGNTITLSAAAAATLALPASGTLIATPGSTSLTTVGTITTGTWNGTVIAPAFGGTGISNSNANTLTLGGVVNFGNNFTTTGNTITFSAAAAATLALPASGTLIATPGSTGITTVGTITTGTWNGTIIAPGFGGTGTNTVFTAGSLVFAGASGVYSQNNANLFWDNTNTRLGIRVNSGLSAALTVSGDTAMWNRSRLNFYFDPAGATLKGYVGTGSVASDLMVRATVSGNFLRFGSNGALIGFWMNDQVDSANNTPQVSFDVSGNVNAVGTFNSTTFTASQVVLTDASKNLVTTSVLPINLGGTGTTTTFTQGSMIFAGASGVYSQNNANLFWNNTNTVLLLGKNSQAVPGSRLEISGGALSTVTALEVYQSPRTFAPSAVEGFLILGISNGTLGMHDFGAISMTSDTSGQGGASIFQLRAGGSASQATSNGTFLQATTSGANNLTGITFYTSSSLPRMSIDMSGNVNITGLTASQIVLTDASKNLVSGGVLGNVFTTITTITGNSVTAAASTLYFANANTSTTTYTLPSAPPLNTIVGVLGLKTAVAGWIIVPAGSAVIQVGQAVSSVVGSGGKITSGNNTDALFLIYAATNLWVSFYVQGGNMIVT